MANYPDSIYAPASKSAGQTITAGFFNDPDGEITAIEGGILNGTARLNSSNSTLATLSVTGGSTLSGTLQSSNSTVNALSVSSNSTFALRPTMPPPNAALVFLTSTAAIASSAASTFAFGGQSFVINSSMHSTGTNPERLIPQTTGVYQVTAQISLSSNSTGTRRIAIQDSSAADVASQLVPGSSNGNVLNVTGYKRFDALGGYCVCAGFYDGASTLSGSTGITATWFAMVKL